MLALREAIALALRLPATLLAAWYFGFIGAVIARALTGLIIIFINLFIARKLIGVRVSTQLVHCWRSLLSVVAMAATVIVLGQVYPAPSAYWAQAARVVGLVLIGLVTYFGAHMTLWWAASKPEGAEAFALGLIKRLKGTKDV